jgi:site-specific recombinase XerD
MIDDMRVRNLAPGTIEVYVRAVAAFARHFGKSPQVLGPEHVRAYQVFLVNSKVSWPVFNQTVCALKFIYGTTLGKDWAFHKIPFPKQPKKLPVVLSVEEVARFLGAIDNLKHRTMFMTIYSTGLRVSELVNLQLPDIDSEREVIRVNQGKGGKDRDVPLFPSLLHALREYWLIDKPRPFLFPSPGTTCPLSRSAVERVCAQIRQKCKFAKHVTPHTFRHSFATHLLEAGTDLRTIQIIMGHRSLSSTAIYLHVAVSARQFTEKAQDLLGVATQRRVKRSHRKVQR